MAKFAVQGAAAESIYGSMGKTPADLSKGANVGVSLLSGVIAGVAAAIISHPADTLLSKVNKAGAGGWNYSIKINEYCQRNWIQKLSPLRIRTKMYYDWYINCRSIRYLRYSYEYLRCIQIPFPRPKETLIYLCFS